MKQVQGQSQLHQTHDAETDGKDQGHQIARAPEANQSICSKCEG